MNNQHLPVSRSASHSSVNVGSTERTLSAAAGLYLVGEGIKPFIRNRPLLRSALVLGGIGLLRRGISGHCALYQAANISTTKSSSNNKRAEEIAITKTITINRGRDELYHFWRHLENLPQFMRHIESVRVIDSKTSEWRTRDSHFPPIAWILTVEHPHTISSSILSR